MDLSICLPLYQQKPYRAVEKLISQAEALQADYEILIIDDASSPDISAENGKFFAKYPRVRYLVLEQNIGRAKMRNRLATEAKGDFMLCLDSDLIIDRVDFIQSYWSQRFKAQVLVGGRKTTALIKGCELRYLYALKREEASLSARQAEPYASFMTGNFFCEKAVFQQIKFDEDIKGYGHEDTLFGFGLESLKIPILQLDNPVLFAADDNNSTFLEKTKEALHNLNILLHKHPQWSKKVRILNFALKIKGIYMATVFRLCYRPFRKMILKNLLSAKPKLFYFDLYRLNLLLKS